MLDLNPESLKIIIAITNFLPILIDKKCQKTIILEAKNEYY